MNAWVHQLEILNRHLDIMESGGYQSGKNTVDDLRAEIAEEVTNTGTAGTTISELAELMCLTEATLRYQLTVLVASGSLSMLNTAPRRYVANDKAKDALASIKEAAAEKLKQCRQRGADAMKEKRKRNEEVIISALKKAKVISTPQIMEATGITEEPTRLVMSGLLDSGRVARRRGQHNIYWWTWIK